jgi:predicted RNA-binding protein with PIN domain
VVDGEMSILTGTAPVSKMQGYQMELVSYTGGRGKISLSFAGYEPCHNAEEVIKMRGYIPEADLDNPADSVFCLHGAGTVVDWSQADSFAHVESRLKISGFSDNDAALDSIKTDDFHAYNDGENVKTSTAGYITQEEIDEIFARTYGKKKEDSSRYRRFHKSHSTVHNFSQNTGYSASASKAIGIQDKKKEYLLVDGYNIIFAWEELKSLAEINIDSARDKLIDIMCNYQGYTGVTLILVFDAYKVKNNRGSEMKYNNIYVVYTKEAETADQYIEKTVHEIGHKYSVTVATSDRLEQMIIWGGGAMRMSAAGLKEAVDAAADRMRRDYLVP